MVYRLFILSCFFACTFALAQKTDGPGLSDRGAATANDDCGSPMTIDSLGTVSMDISGNTPDASDPAISCQLFGTDLTQTTWFTFTPQQSGEITIATCDQAAGDSVLGLYTGSCGSFTEVACAEDECETVLSELTANVTAGETYYLMYADWGVTPDTATMNLVITGDDVFALPIPTLGEWGMIAFITLLAVSALFIMRRNKAAIA